MTPDSSRESTEHNSESLKNINPPLHEEPHALAASSSAIPEKHFEFQSAGVTFHDPFQWLEDESPATVAFDYAQSERTGNVLQDSRYHEIVELLRQRNLPDDLQVPTFGKTQVIKFKAEPDRPRGRLLMAPKTDFLRDREATQWKVLIDFDALCASERQNWFYGGVSHQPQIGSRMLVWLSKGGADSSVVREFDLEKRCFVDSGFHAEGLVRAGYHRNTDQIVFAVPGAGELTSSSGYPLTVRFWDRAVPQAKALAIYSAPEDHLGVGVSRMRISKEHHLTVISDSIDFERSQHFIFHEPNTPLSKLPLPPKHEILAVDDGFLLFQPKESFVLEGTDFKAGLVALRLDTFLKEGKIEMQGIFRPAQNQSLGMVELHEARIYIALQEDVTSKLLKSAFSISEIGTRREFPFEYLRVPGIGSLNALSSIDDTGLLVGYSDFKTPQTYYFMEDDQIRKPFMALAEKYDSSKVRVNQEWAVSADGTRIPFFVLDARPDPSVPKATILYGYGGFEHSQTPGYMWTLGAAWLEQGLVYAVANIRGGGEYGPEWHQAAIREKRMRAYEDFKAVADRLVELGVTTPGQLGIEGGSNGGLLTGHMFAHWPETFGAVVSAVPLLDMVRFNRLSRGSSWENEYGSPENPQDLVHLLTVSPYHLVQPGVAYPPLLLTTANDDRVHPAHARKMAAKLLNMDSDNVYYYRWNDGGHNQSDYNSWIPKAALQYRFFERELCRK